MYVHAMSCMSLYIHCDMNVLCTCVYVPFCQIMSRWAPPEAEDLNSIKILVAARMERFGPGVD